MADTDLASMRIQSWYEANKRQLPWRTNRDPYAIWISEVMLQQTTVVAVIPFYERFMKRFPNLKALASAPLDEVLKYWAGLGYYSRARNLHASAIELSLAGFPTKHLELMKYKGFGPYTARAVSSLAFGEPVGVLDGNVIRLMSRYSGMKTQWWTSKGRAQLQASVDNLAKIGCPSQLNQGLMELGATICTPNRPSCLLCPISSGCLALKRNLIEELPLKKLRKKTEVWVWKADVFIKNGRVALVKNDYAPFLRGHLIPPGKVKKEKKAPKTFDLRHSVTHHAIFVQITRTQPKQRQECQWIQISEVQRLSPSSLLQKLIQHS